MDKEVKSTNKIIGKTALVTAFSIVMALVLAFNVIALASPRLVGDFANRLGMGGVSVSFSKGQYERSGSVDDLGTLCERTIRFKKDETAEPYLKLLVEFDRDGESLKTLAARKNATSDETVRQYDYEAYIVGNYSGVLYRNGKQEQALAFAEVRTVQYTLGCALSYVVDAYVEDKTKSRPAPDYLVPGLEARQKSAEAAGYVSENKLLLIDLYRILKAAGDDEGAKVYYDKLESLENA